MAEKTNQAGEAKKAAAAKTNKTKVTKAKTEVPKTTKKDVKTTGTVPAKTAAVTSTKSQTQSVVIAILSTAIVCIVIVFGVLIATGVIKFGDMNERNLPNDTTGITDKKTGNTTASSKIINNPAQKVAVKDSTPVIVKDLEFYLPDDFEGGGKNSDGAYTYNLVDDDGWAQVLVYAEKSNLTPEKYLMKISPYLDITDTNYMMNGTTWVVGENANALAYATELDGMIYAIYYSVKLDSDTTSEAMQMIPKTLYMKRIYTE